MFRYYSNYFNDVKDVHLKLLLMRKFKEIKANHILYS